MRAFAVFMILLWTPTSAPWAQASLRTDSEIRRTIIKEAIGRHAGECPCPYSRGVNGRICGDASTYKKAGATQICFPEDVSEQMVQQYRASGKTHQAN